MRTSVIGFPRIGKNRELKFTSEKYFAGKISEEELLKNHSGMAHGGFVFRSGKTGADKEHNHIIEYSLKLDSNPEFTTSVLVAVARAAFRMQSEGQKGCKTILDIPPAYLSDMSGEELRAHLL